MIFSSLKHKLKFFYIRKKNKHLAKINSHCDVFDCMFEGKNHVGRNVHLYHCFCGLGTYIRENSNFMYTKIGRFCSIADNVCVCLGSHPTHFVTTHPAFYYNTSSQIGWTFHKGNTLFNDIYKYPQGETQYQVVIGNDVWIGSHVLILGGVNIGDGAVVAAGSLVVKDVEPYTIVGGNPAKPIRKRFSSDTIDRLLSYQWWNVPLKEIESNYIKFNDFRKFEKWYKDNHD